MKGSETNKDPSVYTTNSHRYQVNDVEEHFWQETSRYGVIHYADSDHPGKSPSACLLVYVHGIFGDAELTWGKMPRWVLENNGLEMDVISFAYPSSIWRRTSIAQAAYDLKTWLNTEFASYRHLIFVTHSTGGLIVKHLLDLEFQAIRSQVGERLDLSVPGPLWLKTRRVINIAVPHRGGTPILTTLSSILYYPSYALLAPFLILVRVFSQGKLDWGMNRIIPALRWKNRWLIRLDSQLTEALRQSNDIGIPTPAFDDICAESDQSVASSKQPSRRTIHLRGTHKSVKIPKRSSGPVVEIVANVIRQYSEDTSLTIADRTLARIDEVNRVTGIKSLLAANSRADPEKLKPTGVGRYFGDQQEICDYAIRTLAALKDKPGQMVVTGVAGVGKSTVMRMITWRLSCAYLSNPEVNPLPLFVPLQQVTTTNHSAARYSWEMMWAWWLQWISALYPQKTCTFEWLEERFRNRPTVIIVDGLDDFLINHSAIGLSTIVNILRDATRCYLDNNKLSILVAVRNDIHALERLVDDPAAIFEILPLSKQQAVELFPHSRDWLASINDMAALEQILTPLVLTQYRPILDKQLHSQQLTETSIKNEIVDTFLRRSNLVGVRTQDDTAIELSHLRSSLSIIAWLFFYKSRGEIGLDTLCAEAALIRKKWQDFFRPVNAVETNEFVAASHLLETPETCNVLLKRSVFISTGPNTYRFLHRNWQELLLARFFNHCIRHNYYNEIGQAKLYSAIYRMAGDLHRNTPITEEQVNSVLKAWRETKNTYITSNFIGFLAWTITPINARAIRLLLGELKNFEALTRIILIGGLGYRILVDDEKDYARVDMRRALIPRLAEFSDPNTSPIDDPVACSLAWCYQKTFAKIFATQQPTTAWPELDFGERATANALRTLALVTGEHLTIDSRSRSLQLALLRPILDTYNHPKFVVRAVHYLYYLVAAELHTVHDFAVSQELPLVLATGGEFEQIVESFKLAPEALELYRRCQQAHNQIQSRST